MRNNILFIVRTLLRCEFVLTYRLILFFFIYDINKHYIALIIWENIKLENWQINLDYFLACNFYENLFCIILNCIFLAAIKSWKSLKLMKGFVCRRIKSHSDEKIRKETCNPLSAEIRTRSITSSIVQLLHDSVLLSFDVQRTLSIPRLVSFIVAVFLSELGQGWHQLNFTFYKPL